MDNIKPGYIQLEQAREDLNNFVAAKDWENAARQAANIYVNDWVAFARDVFGVHLDPEQEAILRSVQENKKVSVRSGNGRGKDFIAAVVALCFLYLTPKWDSNGIMIENTKVALTAPTERQVLAIMMPEISRLWNAAQKRGLHLPGRLINSGIKTDNDEWFLLGFKADDNNTESWSGFHAVNTMFIVTEASGMPELVFNAIEGNMMGNSRLLIVFNDNTGTGYASLSQRSPQFMPFRLDSLNAPNVKNKKIIIPGQVDWEWVNDRVNEWCIEIHENAYLEAEGDFLWECEDGITRTYRPNDLFRVKVRGMAPKISEDVLIPPEWVQAANKRWQAANETWQAANEKWQVDKANERWQPVNKRWQMNKSNIDLELRLGVDVAGMGRDSSMFCFRFGNYVQKFQSVHGEGQANHMEVAGIIKNLLQSNVSTAQAFIDTIGEGAGVFSRLEEQKISGVVSVKGSNKPEFDRKDLTDHTGEYHFLNMRAYLYWAVRDWLNPAHKNDPALPPDAQLLQELTETKWKFRSDGKIQIEAKEDIKNRIKRSPDKADALANTFYPDSAKGIPIEDIAGYFR